MINPMTLTARNANISFTEIKSLQRVKYSGWTSSNYKNALAADVGKPPTSLTKVSVVVAPIGDTART